MEPKKRSPRSAGAKTGAASEEMRSHCNPVEDFKQAMSDAGIEPPEVIKDSGKIERFSTNGKRGDDGGWYVFHSDGIPAGSFGDWRDGATHKWVADIGRPLNSEEQEANRARMAEAKRLRDAEVAKSRKQAAKKAKALIEASSSAGADNPYLKRKQVAPSSNLFEIDSDELNRFLGYSPQSKGDPLSGFVLVAPVTLPDGSSSTCELIDETGRKSALRGGQKAGGYWSPGPVPDDSEVIVVGEGIATVLSAGEATGLPVVAALSGGNLQSVATTMRSRYPEASIVILADLKDGKPYPAAVEAAEAVGGLLAIPVTSGSDFNDMHVEHGLDLVADAIHAALADPAPDPEAEHLCDDPSISVEDEDGKKKSQATLLIELGSRFELFHDPDRNAYAVDPGNVRRVYAVRSSDFRQRLSGDFFGLTGRGCNGNAVSDALATIEAKAIHLGPERPVYLRVARVGDELFVDLADDGRRVVRVTPKDWEVLTRSPVDFIRKPGMAPFPTPTKGGDINRLRDFINVTEEDFPLIVAWVLGAFRGTGEYPVLVLQGEEGTGKSTAGRVLRSLTDPSTVALRAPPKTVDDLLVSACGNHVVALDNLSGIGAEMADALCRLSTGGGLDKRRLFTDSEQVLVDLTRPIIVNGIDEIATRSDLSSRSIIVRLPPITAQLGSEEQFRQDFRDALPGIFGAILTGVSSSLTRGYLKPHGVKVRMVDFVNWVTLAEPAMGMTQGAFLERFAEMRSRAVEDGLEASPVGSTLLDHLTRPGAPREWVVTPTDLFETLTRVAGVRAQSKAWPQSPRGLGNALTRLAPSLRAVGITFTKEETRERRYKFYLMGKKAHDAHDAHIKTTKSTDDAGYSHEGGRANPDEERAYRQDGGAHPPPRSAAESGEAHGLDEKRTSLKPTDDGAFGGFPGASCASGASFPNKTMLDGERI